jgi:glycosyltransferase involved in cell wall biosynthesis
MAAVPRAGGTALSLQSVPASVTRADACRVLHVILDHRIGGPHIYVDLVRRAQPACVQGLIATTGKGPMTQWRLSDLRRFWKPLYLLEVILNAWRLLSGLSARSHGGFDLLHVHGVANLAPILAAAVSRIPVLWHIHETTPSQRLFARLGLWLLRGVRHEIVAVSRVAADAYPLPGVGVVRSVVDAAFWAAPVPPSPMVDTTQAWSPRADGTPLRLLVVANLNPLKGVDLLLQALRHIVEPVECLLVGAVLATQPTYTRQIMELLARLKIERPDTSVRLVGAMSHGQIRWLMAGADYLVMPSRSESGPLVVLEAMAAGRPCIASDVGAVRDMLPAEQHHLVFAPGEVAPLVDAIRRARRLPPADRAALSALNQQRAVRYAPDDVAREVREAYARLMGVPAIGHPGVARSDAR